MEEEKDEAKLSTELLYSDKFIEQKHSPLLVNWKYISK